MVRVAIFIDHLNFEIATTGYYNTVLKTRSPKLDYNAFPKELVNYVPNSRLVRTYVFVPKPDDFLMNDPDLKQYYNWINGTLRNIRYLEVIDGEYVARPTTTMDKMDILDQTTYYKVEKGTDVNVATYMLTLAFHNAYDLALLVSGDSDYIPIIEQIKRLGKNVIAIGIYGQNLTKLKRVTDEIIILNENFFNKCLR